jgi:GR25 family glycosyltransferase involved in LPS biosynthesis
MKSFNKIVIFLLICILVVMLIIGNKNKNYVKEMFQGDDFNLPVYIINMDKDEDRYKKFLLKYNNSDISNKKLNRFPAIVGKNEDPTKWLTDKSLNELKSTEENGYRTHHHSLTRGAIGCFLSHYNLAKKLLKDPDNNAYLVFEDDTSVLPFTYKKITKSLKEVPYDWDYLLFYTIRAVGREENKLFNRLKSFWGMNCYIINKKGAQKLINEVEKNKIDGQIDCYLSKMIQQNKINIYSSRSQYVMCNSQDTNIQMLLKPIKGVDPYDYHGYKM